MAPWMVIVALIGAGFAVLLVAPTLHRRINARSRAAVEADRIDRAHALRTSDDGVTRAFTDASSAVRVRDRLLLRGVRAEIVPERTATLLIYRTRDQETVEGVLTELGID